MDSSFLYCDVDFTETQWNLAKIDESVNKTCKRHKRHRIDRIQTCISLKMNQLEIWKLVTRLEMDSSFLYCDVTFTETQWNLAKIDESVNKTCKRHKRHRIDRIQTCISLKMNQLEIWKLVTRLEMDSSFLYCDVTFTETQWNLAKIDESVNKTCKRHKRHRIDRIQTCISLKMNQLEIWKLVTRLEMDFSFLYCDVTFTETQWNLAKIDESVNKTCKTHKKHRIDKIQTCISLKIN